MIPYDEILSRLPVTRVEPLDDISVRVALAPRETPLQWSMLLDEAPALDRLDPDAPNRDAVAHNFERVRELTLRSFARAEDREPVRSPERWRDMLVEHYCRPTWLYTNAQRWFSLVTTAELEHRVIELPTLYSLEVFSTPYLSELPDPNSVAVFADLHAAESYVLSALGVLNIRSLPLRRGDRRRPLLLQPAGERPGARSYRIRLYVARVDGRVALLETEAEQRDPYTALNRVSEQLGEEFKDDVVETCATCSSFRFSGMARDMSGGSKGYCMARYDPTRYEGRPRQAHARRPSFRETVSVFDRCRAYAYIADEDREIPYGWPRRDKARDKD